MKLEKTIKKMLIDKDLKQIVLAEKLELSKENFHAQLRRDNYRISEVVKIADILGYDVKLRFIDRENGEVIEVDSWNTAMLKFWA